MEPARHLRPVATRAGVRGRLAADLASRASTELVADAGLIDGFLGLLIAGASLVAPQTIADLEEEVVAKLARIPTQLNEYGYDPWGFSPKTSQRVLILTALIYRYYFRTEVYGIENFPAGRMLLIANHAGQLPLDASMLMAASILEGEPPRMLRGMAEYWMPTLPFIGTMGVRIGSVVGTPKNCVDLLRQDEAVIVFPEGVRGLNKPFSQRYRLQRFGLGFMRLALETDTPIVPAVVIGSEEQVPTVANLPSLGRLIGAPAFPIPALLPLLGPLALLPLPVKYYIHIGEPMHFSGNPNDEDAAIATKVDRVKAEMRGMTERGLRARHRIF